MIIKPTSIPAVCLIEPKVFGDESNFFFMETYRKNEFDIALGLSPGAIEFVQDNHSGSRRGTLRGLHYQIHQTQAKLVRVIAGEVFDVAVDIRRSSPTFGKWVGCNLSAKNKLQIWIPAGFAHGYYVLSDWAELVYKASAYYAPRWERTILWNDPDLGLSWPLDPGETPILSAKDTHATPFRQAELFN
jgi:dTDP-4-dehydrorhamnose 3,5-epimerase